MKKIKNLTIGLLLSLMGGVTYAQNGLESVIVEKYYVSNAADAAGSVGTLPTGSVTYRIYADLLPGYKFQAMYGVSGHTLLINSTTPFFNNEDRGNTNPAIGSTFINDNSVGLDSWFSVGGAANGNLGVLKSEDNGAANLLTGCPILQNVDPTAGIGLMTQDGIQTGTPVAVTFVGLSAAQLEVFNATSNSGSSFSTNNGSIAALGGSQGPTSTNKVLIGQFTTTGNFHFELNIQIGTPTSGTQNYVSSSPVGTEISIPSLVFTANPTAPTVSSPVAYCVGATASALTATAPAGSTLRWYTVATGGTGSATAPTPSTASAGTTTYYVASLNTFGNESTRSAINVVVSSGSATIAAPATLTGTTTGLCPAGVASAVYTCASVVGASTYNWTAPAGATVTSGAGTTSATITFSSSFTSGNVTVTAGSACATSIAKTLAVKSILLAPTLVSTSTAGLCPSGLSSATYTCGTVVGASSYVWTAPAGATVTAGQGTLVATIDFGASFTSGNITVQAVNACGNSLAKTLAVKSILAAPTTLTGTTLGLCPAGVASTNYTTTAVTGASSYLWTAPAGATITAGQGTLVATISFGASFTSGNISVQAVNACGNSLAKTLAVKSILAAPTTLTGTTLGLCPSGVASTTYTCATVVGATGYTWTAPTGATVTAGQGTTTATISFGASFTSGNISVVATNACGNSLAKTLAVKSTLAAPTTLTGITLGLCPSGVASTTYTCATVVGATGYTWTAPAGATVTAGQGTTTATIDFGASFTSGNISVVATNACGNSTAKTLAVKSTLLAPTTLTGTTSGLCPSGVASAVYTCGTVVGATAYTWTAPTGATVTAGQGTTTATISFGATFTNGNISVVATNACGNSTAKTLAVRSTLLAPTTLTGQTTGLCVLGTTSAVYTCGTVVGATGYTWTAPTGATVTAGQGTTTATISFGPTFTSGSISVKADNACGSSLAKTLVVYSTLLTPGVISGSTVVCANSTGNAYSILPVAGATSYIWTVPTGATIVSGSGTNSIVVDFGVSAAGGITVKGVNACGNGLARTLALSMTCLGTSDAKSVVESASVFTADLYPNPTSENLNMNFVSDVDKDIVVEIYNALGSKISAQKYSITVGENTLRTNVSEYTNGLYFVHITDLLTNEVLNKTFLKQ